MAGILPSARPSSSGVPFRPAVELPQATVHTLSNGLQIIVREDHSAPVVAVQAWCRTGSLHEGRWLGAGLSHVLEHMLFKGTARRSGPRLDQEVTEAGGYFNAYTSYDRTVYWINAPQTGATVALDVLADIMQHAALPAEELERELDVIRREMDMGHDDPGLRSSRRLFETAFTHNPCRHPIIGHRRLFDQLRTEDIRAYYRERYAPNNVFFVVVGDIETGRVLDQLGSAYEGTPPLSQPPVYLPPEPRQTAARRVVEEAPIALGHLHTCWHTPDPRHPDAPALDILATLLGSGRSSRLYREVRQKLGVVHSADAWTYSPGLSGIFGVSAIIDGPRHAQAVDALLREVDRLRRRNVPVAELAKARKQFMAATLSTRKTMQGQAQDLGSSWLMADDLNFSEHYLRQLLAVRPTDLKRVAASYLRDEASSHYALLPQGSKVARAGGQTGAKTRTPSLFTLRNGLRVILREDRRLPFVDFRWATLGGVLRETPSNNGLTWLMSRGLLKGTRRRSAEEIALEIESVGGHLDTYGGNNSLGVQLEVLQQDVRLGIDLLADVLLRPQFPATEIQREREVQLAAIRSREDQMLKSAIRLMRERLFGKRGYGLDTLGSEQSVRGLSPKDLRRAHRDWLRPDQSVLAVVGHVSPSQTQADLERAFGSWSPAASQPDHPPTPRSSKPTRSSPNRIQETRQKRQAVVAAGFPGTTLHHEHRFALELLQEACSDLGSRLFLRIRDELGLAYYVGAQHFAGLWPGYFAFYAGTSPSQAGQVEAELLKEALVLAQKGLSAEELKRAKAKVLGQKKISRQDPGNLAMTLALDELYGLGYAYAEEEDAHYEAVSLDNVREVAQLYLNPDQAVVVVLTGTDDEAQTDNPASC